MRANALEKRFNSAKSITRNQKTESIKDLNKEKNWSRYGAESEIASYKVDMSRVVTVDMRIGCVLKTGIISTIPGYVLCQTKENIYGRSSEKILIPAGSSAAGFYEKGPRMFEGRLYVTWDRIITDNGVSIILQTPMVSSDPGGMSGIPGEVDSRAWEKYGTATVLAFSDAVSNIALARNMKHGATINQFKAGFNQIGQAMLLEHANLTPIITVEMGTEIALVPQKDIWFQESRNNIIYAQDIPWRKRHATQ